MKLIFNGWTATRGRKNAAAKPAAPKGRKSKHADEELIDFEYPEHVPPSSKGKRKIPAVEAPESEDDGDSD